MAEIRKTVTVASGNSSFSLQRGQQSAQLGDGKQLSAGDIETLFACSDRLGEMAGNLTASYLAKLPSYHSGFHCQLRVVFPRDAQEGYKLQASLYDIQYKAPCEATGAFTGYLAGLADAGHARQKPKLNLQPETIASHNGAITFDSLQDLVMTLNAAARSQDQKIVMGGAGRSV
jgi:hypothetical protein